MLKKYLILNLITSPLHIVVCFLLIIGMFITSDPNDWFIKVNKGLLYLFWIGMVPNFIYFLKFFNTEKNFLIFFISSIILFVVYFIIINIAGWIYFHKIL